MGSGVIRFEVDFRETRQWQVPSKKVFSPTFHAASTCTWEHVLYGPLSGCDA